MNIVCYFCDFKLRCGDNDKSMTDDEKILLLYSKLLT